MKHPATKCLYCGGDLPPSSHTGRPRLTCDARCRDALHRRRRAYLTEHPELTEHDEIDALIAAAFEPGDVYDEQVVVLAMLTSAERLSRRLVPSLPPGLAWRAQETSQRLAALLDGIWAGVAR